ncbi:MAG: cell division protein ZapA [candidate division Zixibacteria bacterium]|nr:cell division protein ZapA [candidate division Zixibacteria bacterium]
MNNKVIENNKVIVSIYGEEYPIAGDEDSSHISKVADLVDSRMKDIAESGRVKARDKVAILAAMSMASELMSKSEEFGNFYYEFDAELNTIIERLDTALLT